MNRAEFLDRVADHDGVGDRETAERATEAVVRTFTDRLPRSEAQSLASLAPEDLATVRLDTGREPAAQFGLKEFTEHVAERESADGETARTHVEAVTDAMAAAADERDTSPLDDALRRLPPELAELLER